MRITDIALAFPVLLLAIAVTTVVRPSLAVVAVVIAAVLWTTSARLVHTPRSSRCGPRTSSPRPWRWAWGNGGSSAATSCLTSCRS